MSYGVNKNLPYRDSSSYHFTGRSHRVIQLVIIIQMTKLLNTKSGCVVKNWKYVVEIYYYQSTNNI